MSVMGESSISSPRVRSQSIASASEIHDDPGMCRVANFSKATPS
jgi:hypothetical protein